MFQIVKVYRNLKQHIPETAYSRAAIFLYLKFVLRLHRNEVKQLYEYILTLLESFLAVLHFCALPHPEMCLGWLGRERRDS